MNETDGNPHKPHRVLIGIGMFFLCFCVLLTGRIVWEETSLTWHQGPQMIGFSLAHGYGAPLLLAPVLLAGWILVATIVAGAEKAKRFTVKPMLFIVIGLSAVTLGVLSLPGVFWQWSMIWAFARSPHAGDLMTDDASEGAVATVRGYLNRGVPLESTNYEGSTAAFTAAAAGKLNVLQLVSERGANLNAINSYGDSPLEASMENKHEEAAEFLRSHGARQVAGTPQQRQSASKAIVERSIKRLGLN